MRHHAGVASLISIPVPASPLAGGDPTRRFGIGADGEVMFAGLTRPESEAVAQWLEGFDASARTAALIPIELGVVLSDGAGPHLLDVSGALVLVVGEHSHVPGAWVAMGVPSPLCGVGAVERDGHVYRWIGRVEVAEAGRVAVLDALDACTDRDAVHRWAAHGGEAVSTLVG